VGAGFFSCEFRSAQTSSPWRNAWGCYADGFFVDAGGIAGEEAVEGHESDEAEDEAEGDADVESRWCSFAVLRTAKARTGNYKCNGKNNSGSSKNNSRSSAFGEG